MSAPVGVVMRRAAELEASRRAPTKQKRGRRHAPPFACHYCGRKSWSYIACDAHRDLIEVDPFFAPDVPQTQEPAERSLTGTLLDGLPTKGQ